MISDVANTTASAAARRSGSARPRRYSARAVVGALVIGALAGFAVARSRTAEIAAATAAPAAIPSFDRWLAKAAVLAAKPGPEDPALHDELARSLAASPTLRAKLLERYGREPERRLRATLRQLLLGAGGEDLGPAALGMATSKDALQRAAGFELIANMRPSSATYALAEQRVLDEPDATALAGALAALAPITKPSTAEVRRLLPRLLELTHHGDAVVRAHAVQRVAEWDVGGAVAPSVVCAALADADGLVRQAAVGAVMIGSLRGDRLKSGLLQLVGSRGEALATRASALLALERFPLDDDEHAAYLAAHADVEKLAAQP